MDRWGIPLIGLLGLATLCWYCVQHEPHMIEEDLLTRSSESLQAANIPPAGLSFDGQVATLAGARGSLIVSDDAKRRVESVWGVSGVLVKPTSEVAPAPAVILSPQGSRLEVDLTRFLEGKNVRFATASDVILPDGRLLLDNVARILKTAPNIPVEISGHTDNEGDTRLNLDLSRRRAAAVKRYLISKGIAAPRLTDIGHGSDKPVADNATPEGKTRNRRIEFHAQSETLSNQ